MALNIDKLELPITPVQALDIIRSHTANMGVFLDLDRIYEVIGILRRDNFLLAKKLKEISLDPTLNPDDKQQVRAAVLKLGVHASDLKIDKKDSLSAKVLKPLLEEGSLPDDACEFISTYLKYNSNKNVTGTLSSLAMLPRCKHLSFNNHRMVLARPTWSLLSTSRIQADSPNVQGLARTLGDIITYPKGYILIRADSGQIEPRINFSHFLRDEVIFNLILHYNDAYFGLLHYCTMSDSELKACREDFKANFVPIEITDEIKAKRQTLKTLSNAGSYGSHHLGNVDLSLASSFDKRIVNHPARLEKEREITQQVQLGNTTFYGAFGTPITPDETSKYSPGDDGWQGHIIRCGINNPVQTTASELMICSVNAANERLKPYKDSAICYYKHDEGAFLVSEKDAEKDPTLVDDLCDITAYNVKGWIPIPADPIVGLKPPTLRSYL